MSTEPNAYSTFHIQQEPLGGKPTGIACKRTVCTYDPMARQEERQGVGSDCRCYSPHASWSAQSRGQLGISPGLTIRHLPQCRPNHALEWSTAETNRHVKPFPSSLEIAVKLTASLFKQHSLALMHGYPQYSLQASVHMLSPALHIPVTKAQFTTVFTESQHTTR